jgi:hypothetical protein
MGVDKKIEDSLKTLNLKVLEQGIEKIATAFDQYTEKMGQELASINQRISNIECRLDNLEKLPSYTSRNEAVLQDPPETEISAAITSPTSYSSTVTPRQPVKRHLEPAGFVPKDNLKLGNSQREEFREYRPARGGIIEEDHVKVSVFSREANKLKETASASPSGGRTVIISHSVREDTTPNERIDLLRLTPQDIDPKNKEEIEEWLQKTEYCFNELEPKTQEEVMINYTQLKAFLCREKKERNFLCTGCLVQNTLVCPLCKL